MNETLSKEGVFFVAISLQLCFVFSSFDAVVGGLPTEGWEMLLSR